MNKEQREERLRKLEELIKMESKEKCTMMLDEVRLKATKDKNKVFNYEMDRLNTEYADNLAQDITNKKLEKSRKSNEIKLDMQKFRSELMDRVKIDVERKIREVMNDKPKYKQFLKSLVMEGLVRLLEPAIKIRVIKNDVEIMKGLLAEVKTEYIAFMREKANRDIDIQLEVFEKQTLPDDVIGGVILYCQNNKIVFNNSIRARLELTFSSSIPDIRKLMFISLSDKKK